MTGIELAAGITVDVCHDPEIDAGEWTVVGDLRRPGSGSSDDANYAASAALRANHPEVSFDSESSCFFAYTATRAAADSLVADLRQWLTGRATPEVSTEAACVALDDRTAERVGWLERVHGVTFNDRQRRCAAVLCTLDAPYNWPTPGPIPGASLTIHDGSMSLLWQGPLSTFDTNRLTNLVFAGHDTCVRVQFDAYLPNVDDDRAGRLTAELADAEYPMSADEVRCLEIWVHARDRRDGSLYERHPALTDAVNGWRSFLHEGTK